MIACPNPDCSNYEIENFEVEVLVVAEPTRHLPSTATA